MAKLNLLAIIAKAEGKLSSRARTNAKSVSLALESHGDRVGLDQPHRLVLFLGQVSHESQGFTYDREVWGLTPAQKRYDTRTDLGNTAAIDGDGFLFRGRTAIQITGAFNTAEFRDWCRVLMSGASLSVPDFVKDPDAMLTDPWEGLGPIWYWDTRRLNRYADSGDIEMVTKRINGGLNGYQDRITRTVRYALVMLGRDRDDVRGFQKLAGLNVDGVAGPKTRAALHKALVALTASPLRSSDTRTAPVVEEISVEKPVVPKTVDEVVEKTTKQGGWLSGIGGALTGALSAVLGADWQTVAAIIGGGIVIAVLVLAAGPLIVSRINKIRAAMGVEA